MPAKKIKAILFDMDGVLLDSDFMHAVLFKRAFELHGFDISLGEVRQHLGGTVEQVVQKILSKHCVDDNAVIARIAKYEHEHVVDFFKYLKPKPKVDELLSELSASYKLALVSNDAHADARKKLSRFGLYDYFDVFVLADHVDKPKPDPEPLLKALELLGVSKSEAIYVGDREVDVQAGLAAGIQTILVGKNVTRLSPHHRVESLEHLLKWIKKSAPPS
ncbi:MAG: HAD family hydrolase [Candidatus Micrarchaeota archaeon]|nr:HAD family hydrolase [Candidatus Micrarchaeota archaeon]